MRKAMDLVAVCLVVKAMQIPLKGSVGEGYYSLDLWVGTPPVLRTLLIDTGSSLTGFPCKGCQACGNHTHPYFDPSASSTSHLVSCPSLSPPPPFYGPSPLTSTYAHTPCPDCRSTTCRYHQEYKEGSLISGQYTVDFLSFRPSNQSVWLAFGCHESETNLFHQQRADGVLGLSMTSPLVVGHTATIVDAMFDQGLITSAGFSLCFTGFGGVLTIGGVDTGRESEGKQTVGLYGDTHYEVNFEGITVAGGLVLETPAPRASLLDSGTTFVYLSDPLARQVHIYFHHYCREKCGETVSVPGEPHPCYIFPGGSLPAFFRRFPTLTVWMDGVGVVWEAKDYLFVWVDRPKHYCLGVYESGGIENVLGSLFMRGKNVGFSRERGRLTFEKSECEMDRGRGAH